LEQVYSKRYAGTPLYPYCEYLPVRRRGRIMYYLVEFKTMNKHKQLFIHKPDKFDHH